MHTNAKYIIFDGQDGSGKGTQIQLLRERATIENRKFILTREPGGTPFGENLRALMLSGAQLGVTTEFFGMLASRSQVVNDVVVPYLENNVTVISDRGDSSTLAYQIYGRKQYDLEDYFWRSRDLIFGENASPYYVFLDLSSEEAKRRSQNDETHTSVFDNEMVEFYERVRKGFYVFKERIPDKVTLVDASRTPQEIHEEIYDLVARVCGWIN